jgi:anti-sigma-K factor RskA
MTTPPHDDLRDGAGLYVLGGLESAARAEFEAHLEQCDACRDEVRALTPVVAALATAVPQVDPPPSLRDRVLRHARGQQGSRHVMPPARPAGWRDTGWLAAAAALVAAVGLGVYAMRLHARVDHLSARLAEAERAVLATRSEVLEARRALDGSESSVRVLLAPDLARVDLTGQATTPQMRGRAFYSPSNGLVFTAANMPPLPADRVYQLWLVTADAPVSAGLITPDPAGTVRTMLPAPPASAAPVAFAVTLEPAGGMPAPTGEKVLVGFVSGP